MQEYIVRTEIGCTGIVRAENPGEAEKKFKGLLQTVIDDLAKRSSIEYNLGYFVQSTKLPKEIEK
jgi:hypothetical protein